MNSKKVVNKSGGYNVFFFILVSLCIVVTYKLANGHIKNKKAELVPKITLPAKLCLSTSPIEENGSMLLRRYRFDIKKALDSKPVVHFLTYGDKNFEQSKSRIGEEAKNFWKFDSISILGPGDISIHVRSFFKALINRKKGGGYWIWKIFMIREALEKSKRGDFVLYIDAGCTINLEGKRRFLEYLFMTNVSKSGILSIAEPYLERKYTSGRIFETFGVLNNKNFLNANHYWAGMILVQKRRKTIRLFDNVIRLLHWDPWLISDAYRDYKNPFGFEGNRHDQSLLSVARKCQGSVVVEDAVKEKPKNVPIWATRIRN